MRGSLAALTLLLFAVAGSAAPSEQDARPQISLTKKSNIVKENGVVDMEALKGHVAYLQSKYAHTLATYEKNTGSPHPDARSISIEKRAKGTGSVSLTDAGGSLWYGKITVGSTKFTVDFDTGSSDLFLPGPKCGDSCKGHKTYSTKGAKDTKKTFKITYGDNSTVSGEVFTDSVTLDGLTAKPQALGAATTYSAGFKSDRFPPDGLMGMGYPVLAEITATAPTFNTLIDKKVVADGEFGFKLSSKGAVLYLGGVDDSSSSGSLKNVPVTKKAYWQVDMDAVTVGGKKAVSDTSAIIDTGTTLVVGIPKEVSKFYSKVKGAKDASKSIGDGFWTYPCSSKPKVGMTFGGVNYDISSTFNLGTVKEGSSDCVGGIVGQDTGINAWIAGDVFLANVYAEFSFDKNTVGFSKQS